MWGLLSEKTDVYSYGVAIPEIVKERAMPRITTTISPSPSLRPEMSKVLFAARPMISVDSNDKAMPPGDFQTYTDFSSTSTEVISTSSTSNVGIKAR
ncbi:hypothetical protein RJ641_018591 [Dillenia turbinata]|uniref:Uncharacterized protein n=1 Tax=Dillenia turbinata TaxID=194707 RepID=A0AAN8ULR9_9MAGN